ncbi:MAG: hypothetical protein L0Z71_17595, partial [Anaerolineae bacterium]|nr:hypothetical protein [Anaerolineae bacterium]
PFGTKHAKKKPFLCALGVLRGKLKAQFMPVCSIERNAVLLRLALIAQTIAFILLGIVLAWLLA